MLRPVAIRHYLAFMQARGFDTGAVLAGSRIDAARLHDPAYLVELRQCEHVVANVLRLTGDHGVGFDIGLRTELSDLGIVGYAAVSCKTMRQTLGLWGRYSSPLVGVMSRLVVEDDDAEGLTFSIVEPVPVGAIYGFCVEELLGMLHTIGGLLAGEAPAITRLSLSYPSPPHRARYDELFRCPVEFGAERTRVAIAAAWIERPLRTTDDELNKICLQHCSRILQQIETHSPVISRLRRMFLQSSQTIPKLDEAARELGMSARTLKRHLQHEGTSYQKLVDQFRQDLAVEYLRSTRISPKEIAYLLGFKDQTSFRRAFKAWTGRTVREFRMQPD